MRYDTMVIQMFVYQYATTTPDCNSTQMRLISGWRDNHRIAKERLARLPGMGSDIVCNVYTKLYVAASSKCLVQQAHRKAHILRLEPSGIDYCFVSGAGGLCSRRSSSPCPLAPALRAGLTSRAIAS
jgi:hypothetical protein